MRGHITKRYKNSYTIVLSLGVDPATGRTKQRWVSVKGTKKDAEKKLGDKLYREVKRFSENTGGTVSDIGQFTATLEWKPSASLLGKVGLVDTGESRREGGKNER
ncbi:hypothetical protein ACFLX4_01180 [Chloroflexota bacterium]